MRGWRRFRTRQQAIASVTRAARRSERLPTTMASRTRCVRSARRLFTPRCVIATTMLAVACGRAMSGGGSHNSATGEAITLGDVDVRAVGSGLIVQYRTRTSIQDCRAQAVEMPHVWDLVVRSRLKDSAPQWVHLVPEDASGRSAGVEFTKSTSGQWSASAPCVIGIPAAGRVESAQP